MDQEGLPQDSTLAITLASTPDAAARARAELTAWPAAGRLDDTLLDDARLLTSELVTNSFRHAGIALNAPVSLTAWLRAATLHVEIHDQGTDGNVAWRTPQRHEDSGGFGLDLVAQLSSAWGIERDTRGTTVWFELIV